MKALVVDNLIDEDTYEKLREKDYIEIMDMQEGKAKEYAKRLFDKRVGIPRFEYRKLTENEFKELMSITNEYSLYM